MSYDQNLADCEASLADLAAIVNAQGRKLTEANSLLDQTIEVLEGFSAHGGGFYVLSEIQNWWTDRAKPLLDNLKALKKERTECRHRIAATSEWVKFTRRQG